MAYCHICGNDSTVCCEKAYLGHKDRDALVQILQHLLNGLNMPLRTVEDYDKFLRTQVPTIKKAISTYGKSTSQKGGGE